MGGTANVQNSIHFLALQASQHQFDSWNRIGLCLRSSKSGRSNSASALSDSGGNGVSVAVVWDEAAIRKALPPGVEAVKGMTGGINIYSVERGYVIGPIRRRISM